ncbi:hypothetical protein B0F90DRAFT_1073232 [Multifurca ochricompacta]|uniref:Uncharacterized protein n=1 Tax=Multifurca ochricompacta TaxID=376703 RepID=A0AAD4M8I9_9AGAM|nr:hypothetical protein B0F90DRAFT_1073232 [Multifurca ochricompacta]
MLSEDDYESDYDTRPEVGRARQHPDSDDSDNEASSSVPTYRSRFPNGGGDDDEDRPIIVEETSVIVNPIRQPTAFSDPNSPISSGLTFHKTPIHSTVSANGTSMFCIEGYVNTPELSAGRGGGLSQGLPTDGPYKSLFRADWEARNKTAVITPDTTGLHILANAAQSPESPISPVSATSPDPDPDSAPAPATIKRRNPSPLVASPPTSL